MPEVGARQMPLGAPWAGKSTGSAGDRRLIKINGGYVSRDGAEVCTVPGWRCVIDPVDEARTVGYERLHIDAVRPVINRGALGTSAGNTPWPFGNNAYLEHNIQFAHPQWDGLANIPISIVDTAQLVRTKLTHAHSARYVRGRLAIIGESDFLREQILTITGQELGLLRWEKNGTTTRLFIDSTMRPITFNGAVEQANIIYLQDLLDENTADLAILNNRFHEVVATSATFIEVKTTVAASSTRLTGVGGTIHRVRGPQTGTIGAGGLDFFGNSKRDAIGDVESLTVWWVDNLDIDPSSTGLITSVHPSHVFNRLRDWSNDTVGVGAWSEGIPTTRTLIGVSGDKGFSRRRQRSIPYRVVPDVSGGKILVAAPGYGVNFQIPADQSIDQSDTTSPNYAFYNGPRDRPRSLGVPKGVMLDRLDRLETGTGVWDSVASTFTVAGANWNERLNSVVGAVLSIGDAWIDILGVLDGSPDALVPNTTWTPVAVPPSGSYDYRIHQDRDFYLKPVKLINNTTNVDVFWPQGTYRFAVAYKDESTGEFGLISEDVVVEVPDDPQVYAGAHLTGWSVVLHIVYPGYVLPETGATSTLIYMALGDGPLRHIHTIEGSQNEVDADGGGASWLNAVSPTITNPASNTGAYGIEPPARTNLAGPPNGVIAPHTTPLVIRCELSADYARQYEQLSKDTLVPVLADMPRGAKSLRTIRDVTIFAGSQGDTGDDLEITRMKGSYLFQPQVGSSPRMLRQSFPDEIGMRSAARETGAQFDWSVANDAINKGAQNNIPSSYGGVTITSAGMLPYPTRSITIDRMVNMRTYWASNNPRHQPSYSSTDTQWDDGVSPNTAPQAQAVPTGDSQAATDLGNGSDGDLTFRYRIIDHPLKGSQYRSVVGVTAGLIEPRGQIQMSELDRPGETPAVSVQIVSPKKEDDPESIGEFRGTALIQTRKQTYALIWNQGPLGAAPFLITSQTGCVAPRTNDEHDDGAFWISDRGVELYTPFGSVEFMGRDVAEDFAGRAPRYLKDSRGMMRHAFGYHDPSRGVVWFGLFADVNKGTADQVIVSWNGTDWYWDHKVGDPTTATPDEARSRFPCDEILLWSHRANAFSTWNPPPGLEVLDMFSVRFADGVDRTCFMAYDKRIYAMDDNFAEGNPEVVSLTIAERGTASTTCKVTGSWGTDAAARSAGNHVARGQTVLVVGTDNAVKLKSKVESADAVAGVIVLADAGTWAAGDRIEIGVKSMTLDSPWLQPKQGEPATISGVSMRARLQSSLTSKSDGVRQHAWGKVSARVADHPTGMRVTGDSRIADDTVMSSAESGYDYIGPSEDVPVMRTLRFSRGTATGAEVQVVAEVVGGARVCLADLFFEGA